MGPKSPVTPELLLGTSPVLLLPLFAPELDAGVARKSAQKRQANRGRR